MGRQLSRRHFLKSTAATAAVARGLQVASARRWPRPISRGSMRWPRPIWLRRGEATALELVNAAIARIEKVNGQVNAVVTRTLRPRPRAARGELPKGPFTGVPNLVKDLNSLAGTRLTNGSACSPKMSHAATRPIIAANGR